ncbi:A/G-specific adenine glycosylase [Phaeovibrio sulfidiphilus]|uniref:Adenine DNA glycosylase n=1 Tax=Phaeovibrio sulfidiphilus TaxID=1220600 RepID=A0A8J6YHQ1_9PROT|nr:A/G-specific adenine glycosylase [Phaeovibrio sulfidiphilus]MBE1236456.1 A/G-specific adenine glycosylase [Phaeovibrio sulfidiphilus]
MTPERRALADARDRLGRDMLAWYDRNGRDLPWRVKGGPHPDPYRVWLSEVMLQQTTVAAVRDYYRTFLTLWPTVTDLASASLDEVLARWAGLGYYARARNLHACARHVAFERAGAFPETEAELRTLPGIGAYTAAAIASIGFGHRAVVVDGNVERIMARMFAETRPRPGVRKTLGDYAAALTPDGRPGDYAQALMDLGSLVCTPRSPRCAECPWTHDCLGKKAGIAADLPAKAPKVDKPVRRGVAFVLERDDGRILLRRRPESGLLGAMMEVPSTDWRSDAWDTAEALPHAPTLAAWTPVPGCVRHTFSHFHLELSVLRARTASGTNVEGTWADPARLDDHALPAVMLKVLTLAFGPAGTASGGDAGSDLGSSSSSDSATEAGSRARAGTH